MMKRRLALASWVVAVVLSIAALLLPPMGCIDHSVLLLVAQFLLLCATFLGVDGYARLSPLRASLLKGRGNEKEGAA
ncbi:MAG: hypothetical protein ACI3X9_01830 [Bacteroidaceae bacterium]